MKKITIAVGIVLVLLLSTVVRAEEKCLGGVCAEGKIEYMYLSDKAEVVIKILNPETRKFKIYNKKIWDKQFSDFLLRTCETKFDLAAGDTCTITINMTAY